MICIIYIVFNIFIRCFFRYTMPPQELRSQKHISRSGYIWEHVDHAIPCNLEDEPDIKRAIARRKPKLVPSGCLSRSVDHVLKRVIRMKLVRRFVHQNYFARITILGKQVFINKKNTVLSDNAGGQDVKFLFI